MNLVQATAKVSNNAHFAFSLTSFKNDASAKLAQNWVLVASMIFHQRLQREMIECFFVF